MDKEDIKNWDINKSPYTKKEAKERFYLGLGIFVFSIIGIIIMRFVILK